jgi:hypothetical protein
MNTTGENGYPGLFPDLRRKDLKLLIEYDVSCELIMYSLYYAEDYYSFYTFLVENVFINMH